MKRRSEKEIIESIKSEIEGMIEEVGANHEVISKALNKRYNPNTIAKALEQIK